MTFDSDWTGPMVDRLMALWGQVPPMSAAAIGVAMQLTKNQVVGKVHRLHLTPRPSPIRRPKGERPPRRVKRHGRVAQPVDREFPVEVAIEQEAVAEQPIPEDRTIGVPPSPATMETVAQVEPPAQTSGGSSPPVGTCSWPMWGFRVRPTHAYCCEATEPGHCYCAVHHALAHLKGPLPKLRAA